MDSYFFFLVEVCLFDNFQLKDAYVACKHSSVLSCVASLSLYVTMLP